MNQPDSPPPNESPDQTQPDLPSLPASDATQSAGKTTAEFGPDWKANLVAYLDGELNERDMQELDDVLTRQPDARADVEQLRQTWDLLDVLPRPAVTEEFSAQTLATIQVIRDDEPAAASRWPRRGLLAIVWILLLSVSGVAGVMLVDRWQPDPTHSLIARLSVLERFEAYREIGTVEVITALADTKRFPRNDELAELDSRNSILLETIPEDPDRRCNYIADLPSDRRNQLAKNREALDALDSAGQQDLDQLDTQLNDSDELAAVAADYHGWLRTLRPWQRDEIRKSSAGDTRKITLILEYLDEQERQQAARSLGGTQTAAALGQGPSLNSEDFARVISTIETHLSPTQKQKLATQDAQQGTARAMIVLELSTDVAGNGTRNGPRPSVRPRPGQERFRPRWPNPELAHDIVNSIHSESLKTWLLEADQPEGKRLRVGLLVVRGLAHEASREFRRKRPSDRDIQEYFVGLSREKQDDLMRLPPSESKQRLRRMLYQQNNPEAIFNPLTLYSRFFRLLSRIRSRRIPPGGRPRPGPGSEPPRRLDFDTPSTLPKTTRPPGGTR
jgi:hypothetical protein